MVFRRMFRFCDFIFHKTISFLYGTRPSDTAGVYKAVLFCCDLYPSFYVLLLCSRLLRRCCQLLAEFFRCICAVCKRRKQSAQIRAGDRRRDHVQNTWRIYCIFCRIARSANTCVSPCCATNSSLYSRFGASPPSARRYASSSSGV